jgi:hypothetical protein
LKQKSVKWSQQKTVAHQFGFSRREFARHLTHRIWQKMASIFQTFVENKMVFDEISVADFKLMHAPKSTMLI